LAKNIYCIQIVQDIIQIRVYKINKGRVTYYSQSISVKVKKKFVVQAKWWLSDKKPCVSYKIFQTFPFYDPSMSLRREEIAVVNICVKRQIVI